MLRWLRRILAVVAILIALSVLPPLAYIEGTCRPSSGVDIKAARSDADTGWLGCVPNTVPVTSVRGMAAELGGHST